MSIRMRHRPSKPGVPYSIGPGVGHFKGFCETVSCSEESSSSSVGKRMTDENDITSTFMITLALLGLLLLVTASVAWRRRCHEIPAIECATLHATALSTREDLERGSNGKVVLNINEAPSAHDYD